MPLAQDLIGVHDEPEQALRVGDLGPLTLLGSIQAFGGSTQALATKVGGYTGATLLSLHPNSSGSSVVFLSTTEQDREFTLFNVNATNSVNVFPPVGGSFNGLTANTSFAIGTNKTAYVTRIGPIPIGSTSTLTMGTIASDRWIYVLSA